METSRRQGGPLPEVRPVILVNLSGATGFDGFGEGNTACPGPGSW